MPATNMPTLYGARQAPTWFLGCLLQASIPSSARGRGLCLFVHLLRTKLLIKSDWPRVSLPLVQRANASGATAEDAIYDFLLCTPVLSTLHDAASWTPPQTQLPTACPLCNLLVILLFALYHRGSAATESLQNQQAGCKNGRRWSSGIPVT